ncbi:MAG: hypothetical protein KJZ87_04805 [Thermoguttaceae bacterium]|nr:hypothetical protein [Thermoguttaceae bacterium]
MHHADFLAATAVPLGCYYALATAANLWAAVRAVREKHSRHFAAWLVVAVLFAILAGLAFAGRPPVMPQWLKQAIDAVIGPVTFSLGALSLFLVFYFARRFFVRGDVAWLMLNGAVLFMGASMTDPVFAGIVSKPDNVPIVGMVFLLGFFTWLGAAQAVRNDERIARGEGPVEQQFGEQVLVWPDLIYIELIGAILGMVVLTVWSIALEAPLEQPANPVVTPNPSKAPWYFLGLQELLVYFDPAIAGVILPALVIFGLMAVPYLDFNPRGSGYYTIDQRKFAYLVFQFGFLGLWVFLILVGTFMRGPNWSFFGLYEPRDLHKVVAQNNVKLSEYFWVIWLSRTLPQAPPGSGWLAELGAIFRREIAGVIVLSVYYVGLPMVLGATVLRDLRRRMGRGRYVIMVLLLLTMFLVPLKMLLRWTMDMSYILSVPEWFFNV